MTLWGWQQVVVLFSAILYVNKIKLTSLNILLRFLRIFGVNYCKLSDNNGLYQLTAILGAA